MLPEQQIIYRPFVFIVDSPSHDDLYNGAYSIGMALRDSLRAIKIPCFYTIATSNEHFSSALMNGLPSAISQMQDYYREAVPKIESVPLVHLCMHGAPEGIGLTDKSFILWDSLRNLFVAHNQIKGYSPYICMASCNGFSGTNMATAFDRAFSILVGNNGTIYQSVLTVGYMSFYHHLINNNASFEQAVLAMRCASGDGNFFYTHGDHVRNHLFAELESKTFNNVWQNPQPGW